MQIKFLSVSNTHIAYRQNQPKVLNSFHILLLQELHKVLNKLAKEADCEELAEWVKPCINHFYWSATSTHSGNGMVILAKFKSFLSHVIDKHDGLDDPLYDKCAHGERTPRKWILPGMCWLISLFTASSKLTCPFCSKKPLHYYFRESLFFTFT